LHAKKVKKIGELQRGNTLRTHETKSAGIEKPWDGFAIPWKYERAEMEHDGFEQV
jgi:hypothetical protein